MEIILVLAILIAAVVLFATEKFPVDQVALMVLGALLALRLIQPEEAIAGLNNPATVTVACMFILSTALQKAGVIRFVGSAIIRLGKTRILLLISTMVTVGAASAFINNTGVVAVFLPLVLAAAARRKFAPSRLLIPMSFASQAGGVCTLIGTSTNLLVSSISAREGYGDFSMFELGKLGLIMFAICMVYFLLLGRFLLPDRPPEELTKSYELGDYISELRVMRGSPLAGKTVSQVKFSKEHDVKVLKLLRRKKALARPQSQRLKTGDVLLVEGKVKNLMDLKDELKLGINPEFKLQDKDLKAEDMSLIQALVPPNSHLIGRTLSEIYFHRRHRMIVLAIQRRGHALREELDNVRLEAGDALLLQGPNEEVSRLRKDENFIILEEVEEGVLRKRKAPIALAIVVMVVALATLGVMPIMASAILASILMVVTRCMSLEEAYEAIDWKVIFLLAGILPLGIAMENSGAAEMIARNGLNLVGQWGPLAVLAMLYLLTAALTEAMSNNASAVLLAPIAISIALAMDVDPKPFLMAVAFAASTSFATPVGYQTNAMIYNPGGYKYIDFLRVGIPLNLLFWGVSTLLIPKIWPF